MAWQYCDWCGKRTSEHEMWTLKVCGASMSGPAEYERICRRSACAPEDAERDEERRSLRGCDAQDVADKF